MHPKSLLVFTQDLRIHDNAVLNSAALNSQQLLCFYAVDPRWFKSNQFGTRPMGSRRWRFLRQSLDALDRQLRRYGQKLLIGYGDPEQLLANIIAQLGVDAVYYSQRADAEADALWPSLKRKFPYLSFHQVATHTLFTEQQLPFPLAALPDTFSAFRKAVEALPVPPPLTASGRLPAPLEARFEAAELPACSGSQQEIFKGGEPEGLSHLNDYFSSSAASHYKLTRNALEGFSHSTKFSPWLANGSLSVRRILSALKHYESIAGKNESTYWIYFELLWREYFLWYAMKHGEKLFEFRGIAKHKPLTSFYPQRFKQWCEGETPWPLVNACMKELAATGCLSNRGRQLAASCLVNELQLDWRAGARYFQQQLIDYEAASNWGNWQYIAGVGADPRGGRHFSISKQAEQYDPQQTYTRRWSTPSPGIAIHTTDAADWPIQPQ